MRSVLLAVFAVLALVACWSYPLIQEAVQASNESEETVEFSYYAMGKGARIRNAGKRQRVIGKGGMVLLDGAFGAVFLLRKGPKIQPIGKGRKLPPPPTRTKTPKDRPARPPPPPVRKPPPPRPGANRNAWNEKTGGRYPPRGDRPRPRPDPYESDYVDQSTGRRKVNVMSFAPGAVPGIAGLVGGKKGQEEAQDELDRRDGDDGWYPSDIPSDRYRKRSRKGKEGFSILGMSTAGSVLVIMMLPIVCCVCPMVAFVYMQKQSRRGRGRRRSESESDSGSDVTRRPSRKRKQWKIPKVLRRKKKKRARPVQKSSDTTETEAPTTAATSVATTTASTRPAPKPSKKKEEKKKAVKKEKEKTETSERTDATTAATSAVSASLATVKPSRKKETKKSKSPVGTTKRKPR